MRLLVIGNAVVDVTYRLDRLPVPGETRLASSRKVEVGGKGLNQAVVAHRAGAAVRFVAAVGTDFAGGLVRARLAEEGMATDGLHTLPDTPTDESAVLVAASGENAIVSTVAATTRLPEALLTAEIAALAPGDLLLLQGNLGRTLTLAALRRGRSADLVTLLNLAPAAFDPARLTGLVDILVVNAIEAADLTPCGAGALVITEGADGARLVEAGRTVRVPARAAAAVDTSGAGDVVCGVLAAGLARGLDLRAALRWAVDAATLKVTRGGAFAGLPRREELTGLMP